MVVVTYVVLTHSRLEVYTQSDMAKCEDEFKDLFLNDFILAQKRVAC